MRYLIAILLLTISLSANAQNNVRNLTGNERIMELTKNGLQKLGVNDVTVTIVDMKDHYKAAKSASNGKPWGTTIAANQRTFTIIISLRHEADIGVSFEERIAHELIHLNQKYNNEQPSEKEAYSKQYELAQVIK